MDPPLRDAVISASLPQQLRNDEARGAAAAPAPKETAKQRVRDAAEANDEAAEPAVNITPVVRTEVAKESPIRPEKTATPEPAAQTVRTAAVPASDVKTSAPAREIQLQVNQGTQRVDVRVMDRGGEVHVAVRTPDAQLAGALRGDLPTLSAKLEQAGFRAETWHPAGASQQEHTRLPETTSASTRQDGRNQPRRIIRNNLRASSNGLNNLWQNPPRTLPNDERHSHGSCHKFASQDALLEQSPHDGGPAKDHYRYRLAEHEQHKHYE
jgi:hypothetical protein